jgi:O-antigen ligase
LLVVGIGIFTFMLLKEHPAARVLGAVGIVLTGYFLLQTASRGAFVACLLLVAVAFFTTQSKLKMALLIVPLALVVPLVSQNALHRLATIFVSPEVNEAISIDDDRAISSQIERQNLLTLSIGLTFKHPLFGVGPGEFIDATSGADQRQGRHTPALGTHNTYTQISSESGIIAFIGFAGALAIALGSVWRLHKQARNIPELRDVSAMSYGIFLSLVGFGGAAFFHHVGYSTYLPQWTGIAMALVMAAEPSLNRALAQADDKRMLAPALR